MASRADREKAALQAEIDAAAKAAAPKAAQLESSTLLQLEALMHRDATPDEIDEDPPSDEAAQLADLGAAAWDAAIDAAIELMRTRWAGPHSAAIVASLEELKR